MRSTRAFEGLAPWLALPLAVSLGCAQTRAPREAEGPVATHGVAVGEVGATGAVVWSRSDRPARMEVELREADAAESTPLRHAVDVDTEGDLTGRVAFEGLRPATRHRVVVRFVDAAGRTGPADSASFATAPDPDEPAPVRLAWGGDVAGQNVCRDARLGFPILGHVLAERPDLFVGLGDMIYADDACGEVGRYGNAQLAGDFGLAVDLEGFRAHWRYVRDDAGLRVLLATTPYVAVWDDHEVVNDVGPHHDTREDPPYRSGVPLLALGRRAFQEWSPIAARAPLHRALRWGRHLGFFVLDTRQWRDPNFAPDDGPLPKTLLGLEQQRWLAERLPASDATWKVVVSSVPLAIPTGSSEGGRDGWANGDGDTGFERELLGILEGFRAAGVRNLVWLTTDVHFATAFRHAPFADDPSFRFLEIATGPLNAGLFPNPRVDATLRPERLLFYAPEGAVASFSEAQRWFNFGILDVGADGQLAVRVVNGRGETVFELGIAPH